MVPTSANAAATRPGDRTWAGAVGPGGSVEGGGAHRRASWLGWSARSVLGSVRARNTSSRLGRRMVTLDGSASPRASVSSSARSSRARTVGGHLEHVRRSVVGVGPLGGPANQGACPGRRSGVGELEGDHLAADPGLEFRRRALRDDPPAGEHRHPVGESVRLLEVLGGEEDRHAVLDESADVRPEVLSAAGVEAGRRLVQEDQWGPGDQAQRQVQLAPGAARVGLHHPVRDLGEIEVLDQFGRAGHGGCPG